MSKEEILEQKGVQTGAGDGKLETFSYDNVIVRNFAVVTVIWGFVSMLFGLIIAVQLYFPWLESTADFQNTIMYETKILVFSRLRPLHTNAVIFAFVGNGIFMGVYYSLQRLLKAPMWNKGLSNIHFWGWQLIIVSAAVTLPLGLTQGKEYADTYMANRYSNSFNMGCIWYQYDNDYCKT
jgi:cytochrome c oxidase cbb3-type subunit I/II